jgi:hypothetical protein
MSLFNLLTNINYMSAIVKRYGGCFPVSWLTLVGPAQKGRIRAPATANSLAVPGCTEDSESSDRLGSPVGTRFRGRWVCSRLRS